MRSARPLSATRGRQPALMSFLAVAIGAMAAPAAAAPRSQLSQAAADARIGESPAWSGVVAPRQALLGTTGGVQHVIVRLRTGSVAEADRDAAALGGDRARARTDRKVAVEAEQADFLVRSFMALPGTRVLARVTHVLNAVFLEVDAAGLAVIANDPAVARVAPVGHYEIDLSETVPYIGATAVQAAGITGAGVRIAILDSGIDYTHRNLGGAGTAADYTAAFGTTLVDARNREVNPALFPTAKVVGGYDFVGEAWPNGPLQPDANPIACGGVQGCDGTHGTHVADIVGGRSADGAHVGVAPGAQLYAVKVCSSVATSCSGVALIQGMEFAVDPNGDGDTSDHVDIVNMSLGSVYGQPFDDDLSLAVDNATALGVLTVASAGNSSDKPFVTGSPAAAKTALSVAQTAVPSAFQPFMEVIAPAGIAGRYAAAFQPWSVRPSADFSGPVQYGDGAGGNLNGCAVFAAGSLAGKVVLVDRGTCNFTQKASNVSVAGGLAAVIGLVAPGDPFEGGDGGQRPIDIPAYMISQATSNRVKANLGAGVVVRFGPAIGIPLVKTVVGSSSRGPQYQDFRVKPEIGAPGASVSAIAGSGTGEGVFGGTSGAAPMVTGSAALLLEARPRLTPLEVKALLMNTGETGIQNSGGGPLAPISRIGGGEVRVASALAAPAAAWDEREPTGSLGFGWLEVTERTSRVKTVVVRNYSRRDIDYAVATSFRYASDSATGAVTVSAPSRVKVPAGKARKFEVRLSMDPSRLGGNALNSGSGGANPSLLTAMEYDGYVTLDDGKNPIHLPWHVIPRKAADVEADPSVLFFGSDGTAASRLENEGAGIGQIDVYSLLGVSPNLPQGARGGQAPTPDLKAVGVQTALTPAGFCGDGPGYVLSLAANLWERQTHADAPVAIEWDLDVNGDGTPDYAVFSFDLAPDLSDGRNVTFAQDLVSGVSTAFFFTEHATNTANHVLRVCDTQIGSPPVGTPIGASVYALDIYFGGPGDAIEGLTFLPGGERYMPFDPATGTLFPDLDLAGGAVERLEVVDAGAAGTNPGELGLLVMTNGDRGPGNRGGATRKSEALVLPAADFAALRAILASRH
jgi:minor extracellular serine protease Vpr